MSTSSLTVRLAPGPRGAAVDAAVDAVLVAATVATSLVLLAHGGFGLVSSGIVALDAPRVLLVCATALPLLAWRRWPTVAVAAVGLASTALAARGDLVWPPVSLALAVYLSARSRNPASDRTGGTVVVAGVMVIFLGAGVVATGIAEPLHAAVVCAAAWFAGERTRLRRARLSDMRERAARAEREAQRERDLAVAEERTRIARDLHDSAAHALNVITVRAGAARMRRDPARSAEALADIEELARATMADIDRFIGGLRGRVDEPTAVEVPPGTAAIDPLLRQHRAGGHRVDFVRSGELRHLPPPVDHGVYRILQEALTNAARYGGGATSAELAYEPDAVRLEVTNTIATSVPSSPPGGGHGIVGMCERAQSLGGSVVARGDGSRFRVEARIPCP